MMVRAFWLSFTLCLVTTAAAAGDDPRRAQAEALMKEGVALHEAHKEEEALARFQRAYAAYPTPNILFAIATSESILGRSLQALRHYREAMNSPTLHPNNVQRGRDYVRDLEAKLCRIEVKAPPGTDVRVDGAPPTDPLDAEPGDHVVEATNEGQQTRTTAACAPGKTVAVVIDFAAAAPPPPPVALAPSTSPAPERDTSPRNVAAGAAAGLAVVSAGLGLAFLVRSNSQVSDATSFDATFPGGACTAAGPCASFRDQLDDARTSRTVSTLGFLGAGLFSVAAVALFTLWPSTRKSARLPSFVF